MRITSRLALNGLIRNKKRTAACCIAIAMSGALITANAGFASSVAAMLKRTLGDDLGEYAGAYNAMIIIPAMLLMLLIVFMSVTVISNIFRASADDRVKELGVLRCVGGTSLQIRKTLISEGLWLSLPGLPAGLILGTALGYIGVKIAGTYIDRIVEISKAIAMRSIDLKLVFAISPFAHLAAASVTFITIMVSAYRPAKRMSRMTAIECVRFGNNRSEKIEPKRVGRLGKALWGIEGELGARNISRNRQAFKPAINALATGICLLLATAGIAAQLSGISGLMKSDKNLLVVDYVSIRDEGVNSQTGRREDVILHPIDKETYQAINDKLDLYGDFEVYGIGSNRDTYTARADGFMFTDAMKQTDGYIDEFGEMEIDLVSLTDNLYRKLCEATGTVYGGNILINTYKYNDYGVSKEIIPFDEGMSAITLVRPDGETTEIAVDGYLSRADIDEWLFDHPNVATVQLIVPGAEARYFDWYCEPGDAEEGYSAYAAEVMDSVFGVGSEDAYARQGYTVRISREDNMVMALNVMIVLGEIVMYGFVILLALIGFAGFVSTITANLRMRTKEFAVLKSVGMTGPALKKMIYSESMLCTIRASVSGIIAGTLIPLLINLAIRSAFPVRFKLPFIAVILSVGIVFAVVLIITSLEIRRMKGHSIIETIRADSM